MGVAHHITQRGIARQAVFTSDQSRHVYLAQLKEHAQRQHLSILGYCLMTNHVHLLAVPERPQALATTFRYAHGRFAQYANAEQCRSGHFWQNRFYSCPVDDATTGERISVHRAESCTSGSRLFGWGIRMVERCSAFGTAPDSLGILDLAWWNSRWTEAEWAAVLQNNGSEDESLRQATYTGRPLGSADFIVDLERRLGRNLQREKGGRPKKEG